MAQGCENRQLISLSFKLGGKGLEESLGPMGLKNLRVKETPTAS